MNLTQRLTTTIAAIGCLIAAAGVQAETTFMSADWANTACDAWNQDEILTTGLADSWIKNDEGRGYKVMRIYRLDCADSPQIELHIAEQDGKAICTYGGPPKAGELNSSADYLMWAETSRWQEMGSGEYGPMKAMMFGRLKFDGPKVEAMSNMGPFGNFLLLTGKVPGDTGSCPG